MGIIPDEARKGVEEIMNEFLGIDISKSRLDVAAHASGASFVADNTDAGVAQLCERLLALQPELVVMEASGGYERLCAAALAHAGLAVAVVNARQVRAPLRWPPGCWPRPIVSMRGCSRTLRKPCARPCARCLTRSSRPWMNCWRAGARS